MVCLPQDSDVSKYNSIDDVTGKFDTIEADHYYTFDRELNTVWDKQNIANWDVDMINAFLSSRGIEKDPELVKKYGGKKAEDEYKKLDEELEK